MKANALLTSTIRDGTIALCFSSALTAVYAAPATTPASYTVANITSNGGVYYGDGRALNDSGQVAGYAYFPSVNAYHAFRYHNGTLTDLGTLSSSNSYSYATAINANGQVAGFSSNGFNTRAFRSDGVTMTDLGAINNQPDGYSEAVGISANGLVAGNSFTGTATHAFRSDGTTMTDLGALNNANNPSWATAMNANGMVVGHSYNGANNHAFLYNGTTMTDLGALGSSSNFSIPSAISANGLVAGYSSDGTKVVAFRSDGTTMTSLGTLGGANSYAYPSAINPSGIVVGDSWTGSVWRAFQSDGTSLTDLGTLNAQYDSASARAINAAGQIVGYSWSTSAAVTQRAYIKSPGDSQMIDLNTRLTNAPGLEIYGALGISDSGYILAYSNTGMVLLKPAVPTPPPTAPTVSPITANDPVPVGTPVNVSAQFSDVNTTDTHTAVWTWEGNGTTSGTITEQDGTVPGSVTGTKTFTAAGVYNTTVNVTDSGGLNSQVGRQIVVYDPSAGFVTGGGWIMSPPKAYKADETLSGRATFGFVSKYLKGATKPSGETEFQFHAAKMNFHSNNYEWLVVGGARAQYKGSGTINGMGSYKFLLTAVDGDLIGKGTPDRFRMKIWHYDETAKADVVDYDNQIDTGAEGSNLEGTAIGGGSISIKSK